MFSGILSDKAGKGAGGAEASDGVAENRQKPSPGSWVKMERIGDETGKTKKKKRYALAAAGWVVYVPGFAIYFSTDSCCTYSNIIVLLQSNRNIATPKHQPIYVQISTRLSRL